MKFPITAKIATPPAAYPTSATLKIDGNAGGIPNTFQYALLDPDDGVLSTKVVGMTDPQWAAYTNQDDATYILSCVATNVGAKLS